MNERLQELGEAGLVERQIDPGPPLSTRYRLTADGERLRPALQHLLDAALAISEP
jgi:DNA-binding HxlR family transcriptional regulator